LGTAAVTADRTFIVVTTPSNDPTMPQPNNEPGYVPPTVQLPPNAPPPAGAYPPGGQPQGYPQGAYPPGAYPPGAYPPPAALPPGTAYAGYGVPMVDVYGRPLSDKSKVVAGVLQIALGGFGVGRFYIGDNKTAILQIIVTVFTCGIGHIWGIVDGVLILVNGGTDAQGRILRD
jgi:TM2 domain-containing membrane protein YozV